MFGENSDDIMGIDSFVMVLGGLVLALLVNWWCRRNTKEMFYASNDFDEYVGISFKDQGWTDPKVGNTRLSAMPPASGGGCDVTAGFEYDYFGGKDKELMQSYDYGYTLAPIEVWMQPIRRQLTSRRLDVEGPGPTDQPNGLFVDMACVRGEMKDEGRFEDYDADMMGVVKYIR